LASALYQQFLGEAAPDPAAVQKYYEEHKNEYEQATARHILIRFQGSRVPLKPNQKDLTDAEALAKTKELAARLQKGEDFAMLAQAESDDTGTAASGGSLGSFGHGQMVPEFDRAVFSQPLGQLSEPVRTQFGYHLIKVEQRGVQPLEQVRPAIEQRLKPQGAQKMMDEVKKKFAAVLDEGYFGPATPVPAAAPTGKP
jgi:parvulin-like peptidyl-prolyl isomerase